MGKRAVSAVIGIGIFLGLCFGGLLPFALGATVVAGLAAWEWSRAYQHAQRVEAEAGDAPHGPAWQKSVNVVLTWASVLVPLLIAVIYGNLPHAFYVRLPAVILFREFIHYRLSSLDAFLFTVPVAVFGWLVFRAARTGSAHAPTRRGRGTLGELRRGYGVVGLVYIGVLLSSLVRLRVLTGPVSQICGYVHYQSAYVVPFGSAEWGAWLMLFVAVCVWATDTGAYLVGKSLGKHKLAPSLSPGKTIEGSLGGLALALLTGALFGCWIHLPLQHGLAIGLIAGIMGQWGDLFESALKRELGLKDFGALMPGHGGALDRFDSLLFVTPLAFCYLHFVAGY